MYNAPATIEKIAAVAVRGFMDAKKDPSDTLYREFKKEAGVTFHHIKRAAEQTNVGITQEHVLKNAEKDRGARFPLADAVKVAMALNIGIEKEAGENDVSVKTASDINSKFGIGCLITDSMNKSAEAVAENFIGIRNASAPAEPVPDKFIQKEAAQIVVRELKIAAVQFDERYASLKHAIKEAKGNGKDMNKLAMAISREFGEFAAISFLKQATNAGIVLSPPSRTDELVPGDYIPYRLKKAMKSMIEAHGKISSLYEMCMGGKK